MAQTLAPRMQRFTLGKLDFTRISAEAGAITINAAALLLLLAPLSMHVPPQEERSETLYLPAVPREPPPPPPRPVEITTPRSVPVSPTVPQRIEVPQPPILDESLPGDVAADPVEVAKVDPGPNDAITQPLAGAHLEYLAAPPPRYPIEAIRESLTGTVTLRVLVDVDGRPLEVQVEHSSGHRVLDAAARKQVLGKWRFKPAMDNGRAVQAIGLVPVVFSLNQ